MTKRLIDVDDRKLERAREAFGTTTLKDTVDAALDEAVRSAARRQVTVESLQRAGELMQDLRDPEVMVKAWE